MLKLRVIVGEDDGIEVNGAFGGALPVCELEPIIVIFATIAVSRAAERAKKAEEEKDKGLGRSNKD